jgi:hypothetical protein
MKDEGWDMLGIIGVMRLSVLTDPMLLGDIE